MASNGSTEVKTEPVIIKSAVSETGDRTTYERATLLSLANSPLSKAQPGRMAYVPGITKSASVPSGSYNKKSVEQKKEEKHKKKSTFNPFELLGED
ncbi:hypothetical protein K450DRAFT_271597 [Umbelopsis ramanniana AG]|uniref:Uncharacterized protein n=1 Tax=Umbelopsis ramanniana AG TaxID=1314678 RepID=A0AAD5E9D5_UMBRA|nr:uncharacterized protein K450DRAFT_271597 [Umbelopsis ramanniana AG]KAI8579756.1 hypothetical protein K450DRAFT_271597 [Umbelopsis ramanniana AG]KAI9284675.1 hypothetical protein BC943DRAFT_361019 [Umbelopsis sp. AD052]